VATFTKSKSKPQKVAPASEPSIVSSTVFSSSLGWILVAWQDDRLARISFGHESPAAAAKGANCEPVELEKAPKWVVKVIDKIKKFAAGKTVDWGNLPLAWEKRTEFQRKVQEACQKIPRGEVWSYGELAVAAGAPGAARAVGSVMRTNRFPLVIPCHRVVAAGGKLGGFSCPSGVEMKQKLLAAEGVQLK